MSSTPKHLALPGFVEKLGIWASHSLNFYRVHMLCFTMIPLILSGIFYGANGQYKIPYIDCLFLCVSSMCVTGLATVNLSTLTTFQQFLMYFQMIIGSMIFVSILMVSIRRHFFRVQFRHELKERSTRQRALNFARTITTLPQTTGNTLRRRFTRRPEEEEVEAPKPPPSPLPTKKRRPGKLTTDMITRVDGGGVGLVNPMGWYDGATPTHSNLASRAVSPDPDSKDQDVGIDDVANDSDPQPLHAMERRFGNSLDMNSERDSPAIVGNGIDAEELNTRGRTRRPSVTYAASTPSVDSNTSPSYGGGAELRQILTTDTISLDAPRSNSEPFVEYQIGGADWNRYYARTPYSAGPVPEQSFPRSKTIAFDDAEDGLDHMHNPGREQGFFPHTATWRSETGSQKGRYGTAENLFPRTQTHGLRRQQSRFHDAKNSNFGGFPTPFQIVTELFHRLFPGATTKLQETLTMPRTNTILSGRNDDGEGKNVDYISFSAVVGRNSHFHNLTDEQMDELGGVEYRALNILFWIVISYWLFLPLAGATIIAPYIAAKGRYNQVFNDQPKLVRIPWFAFFQSTSGFSNTGMSLVDLSMIPFQEAYLMSTVVGLLILLGNTCYPIALRFIIWTLFKSVPQGSQTRETLKFLLDHPRRCFVYLFPSTHTWFLFLIVVTLTAIDWVGFLVLDTGTPVIEALPVGTRINAGLFQSLAVRAAGFAIVPMNSLAPAVKVMYVVMMYISVYPIAMSVRATNVYEERALGVFDEEDDEEDSEFDKEEGAHAVAKYLGWHARRQLAFDMWWVALSLWLVCIIERGALNDPKNYEWMNVFNIIFELVSAYGTVGLSLGVPFDNYSMSGGFRTLSKLVVIIVMIRGRHRGLPVAIDRAVMLPKQFTESDERAFEDRARRSRSRRASSLGDGLFSQGSAFPRTFTAMSENNQGQQLNVVPPSPRLPARETSPSSPFRRLGRSMSATSDNASPMATSPSSNPMTPTALQFALGPSPRSQTTGMSFGSIGSGNSLGVTGSGFPTSSSSHQPGILAPVTEDPQSRRPTLTEEPEEATHGHETISPATHGAETATAVPPATHSAVTTDSATAVQDSDTTSPPILTPDAENHNK